MVRGNWRAVADQEIAQARQAGWKIPVVDTVKQEAEVRVPPQKVTDAQIAGVEILELEDAVKSLWKHNIYAASGMGCTGPIVMVAADDYDQAVKVLKDNGFL